MKKNKIIVMLLFAFSIICQGLSAQEKELSIMAPYILSGKWTGKITQLKGGIAEEYYYEIEIGLSGTKISGKGYIKTADMYGYFEISGILNGHEVRLEDIRITNENIKEQSAWCIKKMDLKLLFKNGVYWLEGPWTGISKWGSCSPGRIYLKRDAIRA